MIIKASFETIPLKDPHLEFMSLCIWGITRQCMLKETAFEGLMIYLSAPYISMRKVEQLINTQITIRLVVTLITATTTVCPTASRQEIASFTTRKSLYSNMLCASQLLP